MLAPGAASNADLLPPQPCIITITGNGPSPVVGSVTSTSSGTPSQLGTRCASPAVGQNSTPSRGTHACPNGSGGAACAACALSRTVAAAASAASVPVLTRPAASSAPSPACRPSCG